DSPDRGARESDMGRDARCVRSADLVLLSPCVVAEHFPRRLTLRGGAMLGGVEGVGLLVVEVSLAVRDVQLEVPLPDRGLRRSQAMAARRDPHVGSLTARSGAEERH